MAACNGKKDVEFKQQNEMSEECLICGAPLKYLDHDTVMECSLCHKREPSKTCCENGHYVCSECHTAGLDSIVVMCLAERSTDPIEVLEKMMSKPFCHMHGPEHHVLVGAALLTAYNNALPDSLRLNLAEDLPEVISRGRQVPGGACGYMGACGAAISTGIFMSVVTRNTPLSTDSWRLCNLMTAKALEQVAEYTHVIYPLTSLPAEARYLAFRFAGGTSNYGGVSLDNFVLAGIGKSQEISDQGEELPDASIYGLSYCEAQFTWYAYSVEAFGIGLFDAEQQKLIAGIVATT